MKPTSTASVYQVSDLVNEMQRLMETSYPEIWIEGELSSLSTPASGHLYFSLKDERSQLRCAMFRNRANISRYKPNVGDLVKVRAKISVYPARGDLQCIVQHMEAAGEGLLQRQFEELKTNLNKAGLFEASSKKALPSFAKRIGLITSPSGAAIKDILSTLKRRCPGIPVTVYPSVVQGDTAARSLIEALNNAVQHQQCDVLVLSRGGGSLEDLWCFNDENLAHAIFNCPIPIVSGVGHEVDVTIADLVADYRAPTPTAAAEILSPDTQQLTNQLRSASFRLNNSIERYLRKLEQNVDTEFKQVTHPQLQLQQSHQRLAVMGNHLQRTARQQLDKLDVNLNQQQQRLRTQLPDKNITRFQHNTGMLAKRLLQAQQQQIERAQQHFTNASSTLHAVSPLATLDRGFSITRNDEQIIVRDAAQCKTDDNITVQLKSGQLECVVTGSTNK